MECFVVTCAFQSTPSAWRETHLPTYTYKILQNFNPLPPHGGRLHSITIICISRYYFNPLPPHGGRLPFTRGYADISLYFNPLPPHGGRRKFRKVCSWKKRFQSTPSAWRETLTFFVYKDLLYISIHSLRMEGDSKTAQESVFHFAYPCTILQKRMQKTTFCTRKNGFFRKKGEKFGAKPSASFCAPMIRTDTFPLNFSHRISGSSMSMVSFAPICSTFD